MKLKVHIPDWIVGDMRLHWDQYFYNETLRYEPLESITKITTNEIEYNSSVDKLMYICETYIKRKITMNYFKELGLKKLINEKIEEFINDKKIKEFIDAKESFINAKEIINN